MAADPVFVEYVTDLQREIMESAHAAVTEFKRNTGITPSGIRINMVNITARGSRLLEYTVGDVVLEFKV